MEGVSSIQEAIEDLQQGKLVIVVGDEERGNGGHLIMPASLATPDALAFIVKHGSGIVSVCMKQEDLERLDLPWIVTQKHGDQLGTATCIMSVDARHGTTTGVSPHDRATTILALASRESRPDDFKRPGNIFPMVYKNGGVVKRARRVEASVDLAVLAGFDPFAVLSEIVDDNGNVAGLAQLRELAQKENLKIVAISDLIQYRIKRDILFERTASTVRMPTKWGAFTAHCYKSVIDGIEHVAMVKGEIGDGEDVLVRVHSECLTGDIFGSKRCDCGPQLALAMEKMEEAGRGVLVYLRGHEGRGIGLGHKLRAYNLQDAGRDTVEANEDLGLPVDSREYWIAAQMLRDIGIRSLKLLTNNPSKSVGLSGYGLTISGRVPVITPVTDDNRRYLETKRERMGHVYGPESDGQPSENVSENAN